MPAPRRHHPALTTAAAAVAVVGLALTTTTPAAEAAPSHAHAHAHVAALKAELAKANAQLYALRHERNVLSARSKHLAKLVRRHGHGQAGGPETSEHGARLAAARERSDAAPSRHAAPSRAAEAGHAARERQAYAAHAAALSAQQTRHRSALAHLAALHAGHLAAQRAHAAALVAQHDARVSLHEQRVAAIEAERQKHRDLLSQAPRAASVSGLPIWQGSAYAAQVPVKVVTVDLNDPRIKVSALLSQSGIGTSEPFTHMISRAQPNVAVTGTFFSLDNKRPVGDIVINGNLAYFGGMGTALAITPDNHADMVTVPWGHHHDWSGYDTVVACGPRLLRGGAVVLDPRVEHFHDQHMLSPNSRIAVGITAHNQLIFCMTREPIFLGRLAKVMRSLGCQQAMNLDAGTSTGFYCNGRLMARPGRWLTNAIVVYANSHKPDPEASQAAYLPSRRPARRGARVQLVAER